MFFPRGKLGDRVYYQLNGKPVSRAARKIKKEASDKQKEHRKRFSYSAKMCKALKQACRYKSYTNRSNIQASFKKYNWDILNSGKPLDISSLVLSNRIENQAYTFQAFKKSKNKFSYSWTVDKKNLRDVYMVCAVYCEELEQTFFTEVSINQKKAEVEIPEDYKGKPAVFHYAYRRW